MKKWKKYAYMLFIMFFIVLALLALANFYFDGFKNMQFTNILPFKEKFLVNFIFLYLIGLLLYLICYLKKEENKKTEQKKIEMAMKEELAKVKSELARYVAPPTMEIVEKIAKGKEVNTGEIINVTVLFSDIRGFTRFSENMNPDELFRVLNLYLSIQIQMVEKYDGVIDKLNGDEVMAVFYGEKMAENALNCALAIIKELREKELGMEREWIGVGIGINTGPAYLGPLGSENRKQFTLIGTTVNVAARLCGIAKKFEVLFGKSTEELIRDRSFYYQFIGNVSLKGLSVPFEVFRLDYRFN